MRLATRVVLLAAACTMAALPHGSRARADVKAWQGTLTIPTYAWNEDVNPKFWALERGPLATGIHRPIVYPYVMQDQLLRSKADRVYKALFLENEYLRVTCLPELGGRLHSVLDKTSGQEMFHLNHVIKPGMIALRGAFISGGVEWNSGPESHTVTIVAPVDAALGRNADGSAYLEIANCEQIFRTRWTVRVTLHPGRAFLEEHVRLSNPTDGGRPYYFWNCTAFPSGPGGRLIYPMSLGTDHFNREFFRWPVDKGRDLTWLKNYEIYAGIFAVDCSYDFFGAYDVRADRGIVQTANHHELPGKKAWSWGEWEFGKRAEQNLTDDDGPYIEVQSGPLATQAEHGLLEPHGQIGWRECWYPVHGLGEGFEYATQDVAAQTARRAGSLELRLLATGRFPQATCVLARKGQTLLRKELDLSPNAPAALSLAGQADGPIEVTVTSWEGRVLAAFSTPLPIPKVEPPDPAKLAPKPDDQLSAEELCLKGQKFARGLDRPKAREYFEKALARDPGQTAALRGLAALDFEAGQYAQAVDKLQKALKRDADDGRAWFDLGVCRLRMQDWPEAVRCGYRAARFSGTRALGLDLVGRGLMRVHRLNDALAAFQQAIECGGDQPLTLDRLTLALHATGQRDAARRRAERRTAENPTALVPRAVVALADDAALAAFARQARAMAGDPDFEVLETSLVFADLGLTGDALRIVQAACIDAVPPARRGFMPYYYLAWYAAREGDAAAAAGWLAQAASTSQPGVFASRPEEVEILQYALAHNPADAQAAVQLGCLLAHLGRVDEAQAAWRKAVALDARSSIAWRGLGLAAATVGHDFAQAEDCYRQAIAARPGDQTLYRDLAAVLIADGRRPAAIRLLEGMPLTGVRRGEITVLLAQAYVDERRYDDCLGLLEATPYFVNWEGQDATWRLFNWAHVERGRQRLEHGDAAGAAADFQAALTYPANLNVGRSNRPEEAPAEYWLGKALAALGRPDEARAAWKRGAEGPPRADPDPTLGGTDLPHQQNEYRQKCRQALAGNN